MNIIFKELQLLKRIEYLKRVYILRNVSRKEDDKEALIKKLYLEEDYIKKNPKLHEFDSPWKVKKILPLIDKILHNFEEKQINILDIGGGAGIVLRDLCSYIEKKYNLKVNKFALDLSQESLDILKQRNPDLKKTLHEDIRKTSLGDKELDICLMIDVLEHVPKPQLALKELKRISKYVILKVPLEDNLYYRFWNFITKGKRKQYIIEFSSHINFYNFFNLKSQIKEYLGFILDYYFTNVFEFFIKTPKYRNNMSSKETLLNRISIIMYRFSPKLTSLLFQDFIMILCECY
ncbi:MAG: class I SAM-dependent methyltransferase [Promethearchaeota archaeon]